MAEMENEFISYKKIVIFGAEGSGKTTLSNSLKTGKFLEQSHSENSKLI